MKMLPDDEKATANGVNMTARMLSSAFATWLGGWLISSFSVDTPIYLGITLYAFYAVAIYLLFKEVKDKTREEMS